MSKEGIWCIENEDNNLWIDWFHRYKCWAYGSCNKPFTLCRPKNWYQDYIWCHQWINLCFIQMIIYISCCFWWNTNWKIHSSPNLEENSTKKKSVIFLCRFIGQLVASNFSHKYTKVWCYSTALFDNFEKTLTFGCAVRTLDGALKWKLYFFWSFHIMINRNM